MLQNIMLLRNNRSSCAAVRFPKARGAKSAATAASRFTVRLSSGMSTNILDFLIPQKHVLRVVLTMETTSAAGVGQFRINHASRVERARACARQRAGSDSGKQGK